MIDETVNQAPPPVGEMRKFYELHRSMQGTHHVSFQWFLQSRHTLCRYQRMARQEQAAAKRNIL